MKVSQLIEVLKLYPPDAPVVAEWDQGWSNLEEHNFEDGDNEKVVVFNVSIYNTYEFPDQ